MPCLYPLHHHPIIIVDEKAVDISWWRIWCFIWNYDIEIFVRALKGGPRFSHLQEFLFFAHFKWPFAKFNFWDSFVFDMILNRWTRKRHFVFHIAFIHDVYKHNHKYILLKSTDIMKLYIYMLTLLYGLHYLYCIKWRSNTGESQQNNLDHVGIWSSSNIYRILLAHPSVHRYSSGMHGYISRWSIFHILDMPFKIYSHLGMDQSQLTTSTMTIHVVQRISMGWTRLKALGA